MSDAFSIRSTQSAPPSYDTAVQQSIPEEEQLEEPPLARVVTAAPLVVLAPPTNLSSDTLVEATARNYLTNVASRGPFSSDVEATGPFTFSPFGPNAMLLLPHALSSNSRPLYHISVSSDCFRPHIFTTIIRRGTEKGQVIAQIQRSTTQNDGYRGTVEYIGAGRPKMAYLDNIHFQLEAREKMKYEWHFDKDMPLVWQTNCPGRTVRLLAFVQTSDFLTDVPGI
ncbi:hypothetical protein DEU56DRAFT_906743 [Suillus clintonianus]|uniref:uncharacterized protein n=1 Tax=Suillus clintonianus TaxID=1904413 RepID=UPI001B884181|nr:uncharacterized protein DEU56DRAFT_906743 [Suillus clintonianus]KAG2155556.1 hypothetical protein DEU56DRAFT_906743 [Suillus clintonianus]